MTFHDLAQQFVGSDWIEAQDPVSLAESRPGDDSIPSGIDRRRALEELGRHVTGDPNAEVMEGLFLRNGRRYLGLFRVPNELEAVVGGLAIQSTLAMTSVTHGDGWHGALDSGSDHNASLRRQLPNPSAIHCSSEQKLKRRLSP